MPKNHVNEAFHLVGRNRTTGQHTCQLVKSPKERVPGEVIAMGLEVPMVATAALPIIIVLQNKPRSRFPK